jgi:hypothetical protein
MVESTFTIKCVLLKPDGFMYKICLQQFKRLSKSELTDVRCVGNQRHDDRSIFPSTTAYEGCETPFICLKCMRESFHVVS